MNKTEIHVNSRLNRVRKYLQSRSEIEYYNTKGGFIDSADKFNLTKTINHKFKLNTKGGFVDSADKLDENQPKYIRN